MKVIRIEGGKTGQDEEEGKTDGEVGGKQTDHNSINNKTKHTHI